MITIGGHDRDQLLRDHTQVVPLVEFPAGKRLEFLDRDLGRIAFQLFEVPGPKGSVMLETDRQGQPGHRGVTFSLAETDKERLKILNRAEELKRLHAANLDPMLVDRRTAVH